MTLTIGNPLPAVASFNLQLIRGAFWIGCVAICGSAFAFGAVYPWAYWPMASICAISGALALIALRQSVNIGISRPLAVALMFILSAVVLQLVPLPARALNTISPHASNILRQLYPDKALGLYRTHPLSIAPSATWMALALCGSLVLFVAGFSCVLSVMHPRRLVEALTVAGVLMALAGIIQNSVGDERIYGFWTPEMAGAQSFGPFINKNHFAGWILLVLPVTLGLFLGGLEKALSRRRGWRDRLLWFSTPEASRIILLGAAVVVMGLSLILTMSRSGITALAVAVLMCAAWVSMRARTHARGAAAIYLALLVVTLAGYVGTDAIVAHFSKTNWSEFNNRSGVWIDTLSIARDFPVAGAGLNSFESANLIYQRHDLDQRFSASHNDYLQLLAEGGALLTIPIIVAFLIAARDVVRRFRGTRGTTEWWLRAGAVTALLAIGLQEMVDFSLQIPANAVLFAAVCALALHRAPERRGMVPAPAKRASVPHPSLPSKTLRSVRSDVAGQRSQIRQRGDVMKAVVVGLITASVTIIAAKSQPDVASGRLKIVANDRSSYTILYASAAPFSVREAAVEFQRCVEMATGVRLPLKEGARPTTPIISLGQTDAFRESGLSEAGMPQESFAERVRGPDVFVFGPDTADGERLRTGGTSAGTANGVYSALERFLQVRWLFPTDLGRDVPRADTFWIPTGDLDGAPRFVSRTLAYIQESDQNVKVWGARMRLGRSKVFEHGHNWFAIKPELFDTHPDWFAARKGTRVRPSDDRYKLETTDPDLVGAFARLAIQDFRANPQHYSYSLSPTDSEGWSDSPESLALQERDPHGSLSVTPLVLKFYDDVARIVGQEFPDRALCGYIYAQYLYPPAVGIPKLQRNVCLVVAPNIDYGFQLFRLARREEMQRLVRAWGRAAPVTGYYDLPSKLEDDISAPTPVSPDILGFALSTVADAGMQIVYIHGVPSWGFGAPTNYVTAHLEWDPAANPAVLADDFFVRAYGRAAGSVMKTLNDRLEHALSAFYQKNASARYSLTSDMLRDVYGPLYPEMERTYLQALAASDTPVRRQRLEWFGRDLTLFRWNLERLKVIPHEESPLAVSDAALLTLLNGWSSDLATSPADRAAAAKILANVR